MAGRKIVVNTGPVSLAASTTLVLVAIKAPATNGLVVTAMEVAFEGGGASTEKAVRVEYVTWTTDGTGTVSNVLNANRQDDNLPTATAQQNYGALTPPTGTERILRSMFVDANKGNDSFPGAIVIMRNEVFGIRIISVAGLTTTNVTAFVGGDE